MSTAAAPTKRQPIPFGKYLLLDRINIGGMAEVWRAKTFGANGFERIVAIKRILPNIAEDEEFISMFIDEAKITVQLNHANIGQIYELSHISNSYFIAMEYLSGRDMRAVFDRCRKKGEPAPIPLVCFVVAECCEGLDYAHSRRDRSGVEMNIVHRDVSPQNLLISYDGEVKVIDFGIAKAAGKATKTQAGILKGKFGYMSPEQIRGLPLDRRSDVFAIGVCLWELLAGERLFVGDSDFSVLEKVRKAEFTPPSTFNKKIPESLEKIVAKALAKDVDDRYQSANELANDLKRFLLTQDSIFSRKDLAAYMRATFAEDYEREKGRIQEYIDIKPPEGMAVAAEMGFGFGAVPTGAAATSPSAITAVPPVAGPGASSAAADRGQLGQATRTSANAPQGRTGTSAPVLPSVSAAPLEPVRRATGAMPMPVLKPSGAVAKPSSPPRLAPPEPAPTRITGPLVAPNKSSGPVAAPGKGGPPRLTAAAPVLPNAGDENQSTMLVDPDSMGERPEPTRLGGLGVEQEARAARGGDGWGAEQPFEDSLARGEAPADAGESGEAQDEEQQGDDEGVPPEDTNPEMPSPAATVRGRATPYRSPAPLQFEEDEQAETGETRPVTSAVNLVPGRSRVLAMVAGAAALLLVGLLVLLYLRPPPNGLLLLELPEELNGKASVSINGKELTETREDSGKTVTTPIRSWPHVEAVPSGTATVMVKADGYEPLIEIITVKEGNEYTRMAKKLVKRAAPPAP